MNSEESKIQQERKELWKEAIKAELKSDLSLLSEINKKINTAKTKFKKDYYKKKLTKVKRNTITLLKVAENLSHNDVNIAENLLHNDIDKDTQNENRIILPPNY